MKKLDVVITSWGTISKIDDVRHIGNFSEGTTGAKIAEKFVSEGHKVHYLHAKNAKRPFIRSMILNPDLPFSKEIERLNDLYRDYNNYRGFLEERTFVTYEDYYDGLRDILCKGKIDVVILAAAVSDYGSKRAEGKISSDKDELAITLTKNPKIISLVKQWNPKVLQVGFKLLSNVSDSELIETAYNHGKKNNSDITVANSISGKEFRPNTTAIISKDKTITHTSRKDLATNLYNEIIKALGGENEK